MSLCGKMFEILRRFINWFAPKEIEKPECVLKLLEAIYPTVDWSRVRFFDGLPWFTSFAPGTNAITLPGKYGLNNIHIYFENFDPCTCEGMTTIIHEGFHVLQYNDIGTFGIGWIRLFMIQYFACCFKLNSTEGKDCYNDHPMENDAYEFDKKFKEAYCIGGKVKYEICDCSDTPPSFNEKELDKFISENPDLVKESSGYKYDCGVGYWIAALLVLIIIAIVQPLLDITFVIATIVLFVVSVLLCVFEWIWESIKAILDAICNWTITWEEKCVDWAKETKEECEEYRDEGYEDCSKWKEEKTKQCCTWWPCSWLCKAWTWIVSTICVAWVWVSSMVCIAWVTIVSWVCKATAWVIKGITCW